MHILIVEDEHLIAQRLTRFCREILRRRLTSLRHAESLVEGLAVIRQSPIDVLLLDLNLSGQDGFEMLETAVAGSFHTIVVSAHADQALRAFKYGVLDFVPKPFRRERLAMALARLDRATTDDPASRAAGRPAVEVLALRRRGAIEVVPVREVSFVQASGDYSELHLENGNKRLHDKTLERLSHILPATFVRVHRSYLVDLGRVERLVSKPGSRYELALRDGTTLPVGRTRVDEIRRALGLRKSIRRLNSPA